jgi:hypothetical protein
MNWDIFLMSFLPMLIVAGVAIYIVNRFVNRDQQLRIIETKLITQKDMIMRRLQAYERLTLLLERIHPASLISRLSISGLSAKQLQTLMNTTIQTEFEHNYAQQLYISPEAWSLIVVAKNELIKLITISVSSHPEDTTAVRFSQHLLSVLASTEQPLPTKTALDFLKAEARELL